MSHTTASAWKGCTSNLSRPTPLRIAWLLAVCLLGAMIWQVMHAGGSLSADVFFAGAVHGLRSDRLTRTMLMLNRLQGTVVAGTILLLLLADAWRNQWHRVALLLVTVPGGMLLNVGVKFLVHRPRPHGPALIASHGYAFPSGHALAITLLCGYLLFVAFRRTSHPATRLSMSVVAGAAVAAVAFSRVYLGVHEPSDVAAGILLGVIWLGTCLWVAAALPAGQAQGGGVNLLARSPSPRGARHS